jgi:hypothetical protein
MSSYTSSFKALIAALVVIAVVEVGYSAVDTSSPAERSSYLNWNFNTVELFQKALIYAKLRNAVLTDPDVIQVGDSSGLHAIVPRIVEEYLSGLKYENLNCCANTGFDGYYTMAEFMLRNKPSIKAVVLYTSLNTPPRDPSSMPTDLVGGDDRMRSAFGWLAPFTSPATLSARESVLQSVYGNQPGVLPFGDVFRFIGANDGWWPEHDVHTVPEKHLKMLAKVCGPAGVRLWLDDPLYYTRDIFGARRSYTQIELRRLAHLTARYHAKLVVLFQPFPCSSIVGDFIAARQADIAAVLADYPNVVIPDRALFEPWPAQWFSAPDHLRIGHEDAASRRAGRAIAHALGLPVVEPPMPPAPGAPVPVWSSSDFAAPPWQREEVLLAPQADGGTVVTETANAGWHRLQLLLPDFPAKTYVFSVTFRTDGSRQVRLEVMDLKSPGAYGTLRCSASDGESWRSGSMLDSGIEELPGHVFRCWGKIKLTRPGAAAGLSLSHTSHDSGPYVGDGRGNVVLYNVDISAVDDAGDQAPREEPRR